MCFVCFVRKKKKKKRIEVIECPKTGSKVAEFSCPHWVAN